MLCECHTLAIASLIASVAQCTAVSNRCVLCERPALVTKVGPGVYEGQWRAHGVSFRVQGRHVQVNDTWIPIENELRVMEEWRRHSSDRFVTRVLFKA